MIEADLKKLYRAFREAKEALPLKQPAEVPWQIDKLVVQIRTRIHQAEEAADKLRARLEKTGSKKTRQPQSK